jgi:hypothetical protein
MKTTSQPRRRQFLKKIGVIFAASGFAALANSGAEEEEKKDEEISPPEARLELGIAVSARCLLEIAQVHARSYV